MAYIWDIPGWNSGAKIRCDIWRGERYIRILGNGLWEGTTDMVDLPMTCMMRDDWTLYKEEQEGIELFEWMYPASIGGWIITDKLMTEAEAAMYLGQWAGFKEYRKTGRSFKVPVTKKEE